MARAPLAPRSIRDQLGTDDDALRDGLRRLGGLLAQDGAGRFSLYHATIRSCPAILARATTRDHLVQLFPMASGLIKLKPAIGVALAESFAWVDDFLKG